MNPYDTAVSMPPEPYQDDPDDIRTWSRDRLERSYTELVEKYCILSGKYVKVIDEYTAFMEDSSKRIQDLTETLTQTVDMYENLFEVK